MSAAKLSDFFYFRLPTQIKNTCVDASYANQIWRPDLYFVDSREQRRHDVVTDNLFMEVKPDGEVMISERLTVKISCFMNFKWFPFDSQLCPVHIESYSFKDHQLTLDWKEETDPETNAEIPAFEASETRF